MAKIDSKPMTRLTMGGKKGWKIPMARFMAGRYDGNHIKVTPTGWRKNITNYEKWSPPYLVGDRVSFTLELTEQNTTVRLFNLPFYVLNTSSKKKDRISIDSNKQEKKTIIDRFVVSTEAQLQVWAGEPEQEGSLLLVQADAWNPTNTIMGLIGIVIGVIIKWLLDLIVSLF